MARRYRNTGTSTAQVDETYDLRGLNLIAPDQVMPPQESPYNLNARMYARENAESRVAIRTRKGSRRLSTPVGETLNVQNVAGSTGDVTFTKDTWVTMPFTPSSSGALTKLDLEIKKTISGGGHVIVGIYSNVSGLPGVLLAQSSIDSSVVTSAYQYLSAYFIDAPSLVNGTQYWQVIKVQALGSASYALTKTAAAGAYSTVNSGVSYTALGYSFRFKTYLSTAGVIKGFTRRYPQDGANRTIFAMGTNVYSTTDLGVPTSISTDIHTDATAVRFDQVDDKTLWVDGKNPARWYDGTSTTVINNVAGNPTHLAIFQNRAFFVPDNDPTRVNFSDLNNFESYTSTNFFYVPSPKSPDHIAALIEFQDNLHIFTRETKHTVFGTNLSDFTRKQAVGTKGAVSQEAVVADRNYIYFMADDKHIYRYNGIDDEILSEKIEPELQTITDVSKVRLHLYRNQLRVYYPRTPSNTADNMLLLELSKRDSNKYLQWFRDTGRPVLGSLEWTQDNNQLIEFSSKVGAFYLGETDESDLGKAISFRYWTPYKAYGSGAAKDRIKRFRPIVRPSDAAYNLYVGKDIDFQNQVAMTAFLVDAGGAKWGSFRWGDGTIWGSGKQLVDDKVAMSGRGKYTQYRFECDTVDTPVEIYGYIALIKSGRIR